MNEKTQNGFTLLELMITITVAAILIAVGVPGMQEFVQNNRRAAEVNEFVSALQLARSEAVARNKRVVVCSSTDSSDASPSCAQSGNWETGWIVYVDDDADQSLDAAEEILRSASGPEAMTIRSSLQRVSYRPNGHFWGGPGSNITSGNFTFCDDRGADLARVVQLDLGGRPAIDEILLDGSTPSCP